jgi:hypothetical protein
LISPSYIDNSVGEVDLFDLADDFLFLPTRQCIGVDWLQGSEMLVWSYQLFQHHYSLRRTDRPKGARNKPLDLCIASSIGQGDLFRDAKRVNARDDDILPGQCFDKLLMRRAQVDRGDGNTTGFEIADFCLVNRTWADKSRYVLARN